MKKTLAALVVASFAASSASAVTLLDKDGTKVEQYGSLRLVLDKASVKENGTTTKRAHSNLRNDGSRFGFKAKHEINEDLYALGQLEFRFDKDKGTDSWGDVNTKRGYVGLGSKQFGEVKFGRQLTIGDDISQAGYDYQYGVWDGTLTSSGYSVVRYDYNGIEGLQLGVDYRFAENRQNNEVVDGSLKNGYGVGAVYELEAGAGQKVTLASGYTRDNFATGSSVKHHKDAWQAAAKYEVDALELAIDYAGAFVKKGSEKGRINAVRVGAKYHVTDALGVYGNYGHGVAKTKAGNVTTEKNVYNRFMLGTDYKLHKQVLTYLEGSVGKVKTTVGNTVTKATEKSVGVGLRVHW